MDSTLPPSYLYSYTLQGSLVSRAMWYEYCMVCKTSSAHMLMFYLGLCFVVTTDITASHTSSPKASPNTTTVFIHLIEITPPQPERELYSQHKWLHCCKGWIGIDLLHLGHSSSPHTLRHKHRCSLLTGPEGSRGKGHTFYCYVDLITNIAGSSIEARVGLTVIHVNVTVLPSIAIHTLTCVVIELVLEI